MSKRNKKNNSEDFEENLVKAPAVSTKECKNKTKKGKNKKQNFSDDENDEINIKIKGEVQFERTTTDPKSQIVPKENKSKSKKGKLKKDDWSDNEEENKVLLNLNEESADELLPSIKKSQKKCMLIIIYRSALCVISDTLIEFL